MFLMKKKIKWNLFYLCTRKNIINETLLNCLYDNGFFKFSSDLYISHLYNIKLVQFFFRMLVNSIFQIFYTSLRPNSLVLFTHIEYHIIYFVSYLLPLWYNSKFLINSVLHLYCKRFPQNIWKVLLLPTKDESYIYISEWKALNKYATTMKTLKTR